MSICASICLTVSSATPTTMMTEVPPRATLERFVEIAPTISGTSATMPRNTAPTKVTLPRALVMKSEVGLPGTEARDEAAVLLQVVGDLDRVKLDGCIEICESEDQQCVQNDVDHTSLREQIEDVGTDRTSLRLPEHRNGLRQRRMEDAKMIGITPEALTLMGKWVD